DADTAPGVEGVPEHQQLRLGVGRRPLPGAPDPGPADLDPPVVRADVREPGAADHPAAGALDRRERHRLAGGRLGEREVEVTVEVAAAADPADRPAPELRVASLLPERVAVDGGERFQPHVTAGEG